MCAGTQQLTAGIDNKLLYITPTNHKPKDADSQPESRLAFSALTMTTTNTVVVQYGRSTLLTASDCQVRPVHDYTTTRPLRTQNHKTLTIRFKEKQVFWSG